jgi:anti-sigma regulatory factor (Ser/Thr protein kinase)
MRLSPGSDTVARARHFVASAVCEFGRSETAEDASLCASELVTNALRYATGPCDVVVSSVEGTIRIDVWDTATQLPGPLVPSQAESGRGLAIVGSIASRWGVDVQREGGKAVWCQLNSP